MNLIQQICNLPALGWQPKGQTQGERRPALNSFFLILETKQKKIVKQIR